MQHVGQCFRVHETVLDGHVEQSAQRKSVATGGVGIGKRVLEFLVQGSSNFADIIPNCGNRWPVEG